MGTSEIIELTEDSNGPHSFSFNRLRVKVKPDSKDKQPMDQNLSKFTKNMYKAPMNNKPGPSKQSQIEITESVTLKQALRKLCITQASEMAAMKRSNKLIGLTDSGNIKRLYASVLIESSTEKNNNLVEISIFEDKPINPSELSINKGEIKTEPKLVLNKIKTGSNRSVSPANKTPKMRIQDVINQDSKESTKKDKKGKTVSKSCDPSTHLATPRLVKPIFRNKTTVKKKIKPEPSTTLPNPPKTPKPLKSNNPNSPKNPKPLKSNPNHPNSTPIKSTKPITPPIESKKPIETATPKAALERKEKGEWSQSSKSSMGDYSNSSSTTSLSEDSHTGSGHKTRPHMSKDFRWVAIKRAIMQNGPLTLDNFKLIKRLGCGDIGTVYLAELAGSDCLFALKVMDVDFLVSRKKMLRAQTEREILQMLDHPFLPTLYSHFITDNLACLVMEFCPGGDLHVLRQKQPTRCFSEPAARFYVAEVLLALEYLHMLGVIYRDLKPENILVREDGHIMLSDFDLSLRCSVSPTLLKSDPSGRDDPAKSFSLPCSENNCMNMDPICLKPVSCFTPRLVSHSARNRSRFDSANQNGSLPQLVVEPTDARSNSFVGTHEYLAPEIIRGDGHGSSVDWWTLGVFLYELLYGKTPFKGPGNDETLSNVISQNLKFVEGQNVSFHAKDLIRGLLVKDPEMRMGSVRGAAEIKNHPFFDGLNWALIRCAIPPETPRDLGSFVAKKNKKENSGGGKCLDFGTSGDNIEFELF